VSDEWSIYSEARPLGGEPVASTDDFPDETAAREAFGARRYDAKYAGSRVRWLLQLRHGDEIVDEFKSPE
jgi:hypothetical protein